jgi:hypothetical protein
MASKRQIVANRRNAKKGGVKTAKGKAASRLNALKHGILSREAVIRRGDVAESEEERQAISGALRAELKPVGFVEHYLVDLLLVCIWKMRRVISAERAGLESTSLTHIERERTAKTLAPDIFLQSKDRWNAALQRAKALAAHLEKVGFPLSDEWETEMLLLIREGEPELTEAVEPLYMAQHLYKMQKTVLTLDNPIHALMQTKAQKVVEIAQALRQRLIDRDEHMYHASAEAAVIGSELALRYMTAYQKQMMQTLHELERQQAKRLGRRVPLASVIDVILGESDWVRLENQAHRSLSVPSHDVLGIGKMALGRANLAISK